MIPPERALVCTHPTLVSRRRHSLLPVEEVACVRCHWLAAVPFPLVPVDPIGYPAFCIGFTFGEHWAREVYQRLWDARYPRYNPEERMASELYYPHQG